MADGVGPGARSWPGSPCFDRRLTGVDRNDDRGLHAVNELAVIPGLALLPAAGNLIGGLIAEVARPSPKAVSIAVHGAVGLIFAIVATELLPQAASANSGRSAVAFVCGFALFVLVTSGPDRINA